MRTGRARWGVPTGASAALGTVLLCLLALTTTNGQTIIYSRGQNVAPAFEGWAQNPDGTFTLVFGYMNRNMDEKLHIPIGPDNKLEPGNPDQGQPTYFLPRRNRYVFDVVVPADFEDKEIVWTLTVKGKTGTAYGSLRPDYIIDNSLKMKDLGGLGAEAIRNEAPVVSIDGSRHRTVTVGESLTLTAVVSDDGIPASRRAASRMPVNYNALGLRVAWFVYRGTGNVVAFQPEQFKVYPDYRGNSPWTPGWAAPPIPADGRFPVTAVFGEPGTYVLRVMAHDGGLLTNVDATVVVTQ